MQRNTEENNPFQSSISDDKRSAEYLKSKEIARLKTLRFEKPNPIRIRVLTTSAYWTLRLVIIGQLLVNCLYFAWLGYIRFRVEWVKHFLA